MKKYLKPKYIIIFLFLLIFIYDTYNLHVVKKDKKTTDDITVEYENAGNLMINNVVGNETTSIKVHVKNETDNPTKISFGFFEVINPLNNLVYYSVTRDNNTVLMYQDTLFNGDFYLNNADNLNPKEDVDYVFTISIKDIDASYIHKNVQTRIKVIEEEWLHIEKQKKL